ncbi:hypothetical protein J6590_102029 [Homalodisca vitripennis]|nr:hypothetical protein J6590_102029 [Homalodisca vitripennis]
MSQFGGANNCFGGKCEIDEMSYTRASQHFQLGWEDGNRFDDVNERVLRAATYVAADQPIPPSTPPSPSPSSVPYPGPSFPVGLASTADGENVCQCEYMMFDNFKWVKQRHYVVAKDGREYFDRYVVTYRLPNSNVQYDMFTYTEGLVHNRPIEAKFPYLCGEVVALHALPPVNSLTTVCYYTPPSVDPTAPFHVQEQVCKSNTLTAVPLAVDNSHQVLVVRTYNNSLALQLMPTAYSERPVLSGTPLFHDIRKTICATVGNMFSEFHYVINGSPCVFALFSIGGKEVKREPNEGDRMRVVVLDRRDRVDSEEWSANESAMNSVLDVAMPVLQRVEGKQARLDVRDIMYVGVVNSDLQLTDAPNYSKKYKTPKNAVVAVIDNRGVYAAQRSATTLFRQTEIKYCAHQHGRHERKTETGQVQRDVDLKEERARADRLRGRARRARPCRLGRVVRQRERDEQRIRRGGARPDVRDIIRVRVVNGDGC